MNEFFIIDRATRDALIDYLGLRPFKEVEVGIEALRNLQRLPDGSEILSIVREESSEPTREVT